MVITTVLNAFLSKTILKINILLYFFGAGEILSAISVYDIDSFLYTHMVASVFIDRTGCLILFY